MRNAVFGLLGETQRHHAANALENDQLQDPLELIVLCTGYVVKREKPLL